MTTIKDVINSMNPILQFSYITADRLSLKFWSAKPKYDKTLRVWRGSSDVCTCVAMLDLIGKINLEEFRENNRKIAFDKAIFHTENIKEEQSKTAEK